MDPRTTTARTPATVQGLVIPAEWNHEGGVVAVAIAAFDENVYLVRGGALADQLLSLVHGEVEVTGLVSETPAGTQLIEIQGIRKQRRP